MISLTSALMLACVGTPLHSQPDGQTSPGVRTPRRWVPVQGPIQGKAPKPSLTRNRISVKKGKAWRAKHPAGDQAFRLEGGGVTVRLLGPPDWSDLRLDIQAHGAAFRYDGTGEWQAGESGAHPVALKGYLQALAAEDTDRLDALSCALDQAIHGDALLGEDPVSGQASLGTLNLILKCLLELQARVGTQAMAATRA